MRQDRYRRCALPDDVANEIADLLTACLVAQYVAHHGRGKVCDAAAPGLHAAAKAVEQKIADEGEGGPPAGPTRAFLS